MRDFCKESRNLARLEKCEIFPSLVANKHPVETKTEMDEFGRTLFFVYTRVAKRKESYLEKIAALFSYSDEELCAIN